MSEPTLEEALLGRRLASPNGVDSGSSAPSLLLQIVLPVTLILGLVVSTKIHEYNALLHDLRGDPFHQKYEQAYLEIEKHLGIRTGHGEAAAFPEAEHVPVERERAIEVRDTDADMGEPLNAHSR